jgi:glycosyltransferase involved in cell wall biosynthesis
MVTAKTAGTPAGLASDTACGTPNGLQALVCQLGAREHYLVARCFAKCGSLSLLATDFWSPVRLPRRGLFRRLPRVLLSAIARRHDELDNRQVASFPLLSAARYGIGFLNRRGAYEGAIARRFARGVEALNAPHNVFFGYSYDSLELLQWERSRGVFTVLCQTDPGPTHYRMIGKEQEQWPEYGSPKGSFWSDQRFERLRQEWKLADVIIANSQWTRDSIIAEGAEAAKIEILSLAYDTGDRGQRTEGGGQWSVVSGPLKVLWLGNVSLGKGIQYLVEAARSLVNEPVQFSVGGSSYISDAVVSNSPGNIRWLGQIPRSGTDAVYNDCDVFVFPTLSDGFGITQLEALTHGLPVITTPNCGRVVEEGKTGFFIPARDPKALAEAILKFVRNRQLLEAMRPRCLEAVKAFSVEAYGRRLVGIIQERMSRR